MNKTNSQSGFSAVEILMVAVVVLLVGAVGYSAYNQFVAGDKGVASVSSSQSLSESEAELSDVLALPKITEIAASQVGDLKIVGIELEANDSGMVYVVHYSDGSSVVFDAMSGEKLALKDNNNDDIEGKAFPSDFTAKITIQEAISIAKQKRPNSTLQKVEIEIENGVVVYSVRFTDESRVDVSASDGTVQRLKDETGKDVIKLESSDDDQDDDHKSGSKSNDDDDNDDHSVSGSSKSSSSNDDDDDNSGSGSSHDDEDDDDDHSGSGS